MFGELVGGAGCVGGQEKQLVGYFLDDLRAFGINADQWMNATQDERGEMAQDGGRFSRVFSYHYRFSLYGQYIARFPLPYGVFPSVTTGLILASA